MRIASGRTDNLMFFVAVDPADLKTRITGLTTSFTVTRSRNGGTAGTYTTPTIDEVDAALLPGVYTLVIDEDTTISSGFDEEEMCIHIAHASMAPVTRTIEIFRPKTTEGTTVTVAQNGVNLADNAVAAAKIASDAITAAKVASDVTTEIQSGLATAAALATVGGTVDAIVADTVDIQSRLPASLVSGRIDASIGAVAAGAINRAGFAADTGLQPVRSNTAQAGGASTITLDASASATTDFYVGLVVLTTGGTGAGQSRTITAYNGTTKVATVDSAWATNPSSDTTFSLLPSGAAGSAPSAATIADAVWDEVLSGHLTGGSTGAGLNAAGSAGDPWSTALPGAYSSGTAGKIIGDNLNATVSSRASQTSVDTIDGLIDAIVADIADIDTRLPAALVSGRMDSSVGAMASGVLTATAIASAAFTAAKFATGALAADGAAADFANKLADHIWRRTYANVRASANGDTVIFRSALGMLAHFINKWDLSGGNLVLKHEDDTSTFATIPVSTSAGAEPIIGKDPA